MTTDHGPNADYVARFTPQAWINDNAIDVDPEGEQEWDCTDEFRKLRPDYRKRLLEEIFLYGEALDGHDCLKGDPNAPEWVREWSGPFSIYVRPVVAQNDSSGAPRA